MFANPRQRFAQHKANAAQRGVEFDMTFEEWWAIWEPRFQDRGRNKGQVVMCRTRDEGAYRSGNVRIDTVEANSKERQIVNTNRKFAAAWDQNPDAADWLDARRRGAFSNPYFIIKDREQDASL